MSKPAAIALFAYRRLEHTMRTVEALALNELAAESDLYVFCDGPRNEDDRRQVLAVQNYACGIKGFKSVTPFIRSENMGLAGSIISGVSEVLELHDRVIVVEDDIVTSPFFLKFINEGLALYKDDEQVASIHGYVYPVKQQLPESFFLRGADCWGWGTWRRGWDLFNSDGSGLLREIELRGLASDFDFGNAFPFTQMLRDQVAGKNDSWAIRWYASAFVAGKLTLYPGRSLVQNIGDDGSGTHAGSDDVYRVNLQGQPIDLKRTNVEVSVHARHAFAQFFNQASGPRKKSSLFSRIKRWLRCL